MIVGGSHGHWPRIEFVRDLFVTAIDVIFGKLKNSFGKKVHTVQTFSDRAQWFFRNLFPNMEIFHQNYIDQKPICGWH